MDAFQYGPVFLDAKEDSTVAEKLFEEWIAELQASPPWSESHTEGRRILWRLAGTAAEHFKQVLACPGCYVFGASPVILRYVGETGQKGRAVSTLDDRLFGRYLRKRGRPKGKPPEIPCQFFLAEDYEEEIKARGIAAFPTDLVQKYKSSYSGGMARLYGAVDFVKHGLDGIWFTVLPLDDRSRTKVLERLLIGLANRWNSSHGYEHLCQVEHGYEYVNHLDGARPK